MLIPMDTIIFLAWFILIIGFLKKDYTITSLASMFLMVIGTSILLYGVEGIDNLITLGMGVMHIGIGFYVLFRGGTEVYKGRRFQKPHFIKRGGEKELESEEKKETEEIENV